MKCKLYNVFKLVLLIYVIGIAFLCFSHLDDFSHVPKVLWGLETDKIVHFAMFFPLPFIAFFAFDHSKEKRWERVLSVIYIASLACIFAGLTEIVQGALPYRSEDPRDFATDCLAIVLACVIVLIISLLTGKHGKK